jgi:hypothetical protein
MNGKRLAAWLVVIPAVSLQSGAARYSVSRLECAAYHEEVRTEIRSKSGSVSREERAGRDGVLRFRASGTDSLIELTAWYDSLAVWREGPEGRITPDTEGLLGGRWRGTLAQSGRYVSLAAPFIPDAVAEIAELRGMLDDFLPLLPDSALGSGSRYTWTRHSVSDSTTIIQDSIAVPVRRETDEAGNLDWDAGRGPVRWERTLTVTARIPAGKQFTRGVTTLVIQRVSVTRQSDRCEPGEQ